MRSLAIIMLASAVGFAAVLAVGRTGSTVSPPPPDLTQWQRLEANEPAADFALLNQDSRRVTLKDLSGKAVVMTFFYGDCADVCPIQLNVLDDLARDLTPAERERLALVGMTIDPARDTPARLQQFLAERGLDAKRWQLLTGTLAEVTKVANDYGIAVRPAPRGDLVHNSVYILIDAQGIERVELHGIATPRAEIIKDLRAILAASATGPRS